MHTFVRRTLWGVALAGGLTLAGATAATAADTSGDDGILSGIQILAPLNAPLHIVDNAISVLGNSLVQTVAPVATPAPAPVPEVDPAPAGPMTSGDQGIASGTQAVIDLSLPINISGNAISVLGESEVTAAPVAVPEPTQVSATPVTPDSSVPLAPSIETSGIDGLLAGTQALVSIDIPITIDGNAISLLGESSVDHSASAAAPANAPVPAGMNSAETSGANSILGGTQILAPINIPVNLTNNAIAILGESTVTGGGATPAGTPTTGGGIDLLAPITNGLGSLLGGTQIALPISIPINISGNAISILGESTVITPGVNPGTDPTPGTDPDPNPGTDPDPNPGVDPDPQPSLVPALVVQPAPAVTATSAATLAVTGGSDLIAPVMLGMLLLAAGALLIRRARVSNR